MARKPSPPKTPKLSAEQRATLQRQTITAKHPGTILRDFEALLNAVAEHEVPLSGVRQLPALKVLSDWNARLAHPLDVKMQRPQLKSFPHLAGLYLLLRATGLALAQNQGKGHVLRVNAAALPSWRGLNPTEAYFTLLEAWFRLGDEEVLGERAGFLPALMRCLTLLRDIPAGGQSIATPGEAGQLRYFPGLHNLALLEAFGLVDIRRGATQPNGGWNVEHVARNAWGDAVFALLSSQFPDAGPMANFEGDVVERFIALFAPEAAGIAPLGGRGETDEAAAAEEPLFGHWQELFQPFFPTWQHKLQLPEPEIHKGLYVFKVSLGKVWRRIAIPWNFTLDSLSGAILDAFKFDHDHLYLFAFRNDFGSTVKVGHSAMEGSPSTVEVFIGTLPLHAGDAMTFLFDFGEDWKFGVLLERIEEANAHLKKPRVLESHGKAPQQYPDWDGMEQDD